VRHEYPAVMVRSVGKPVKGARVTFQLPESGPGGYFERQEPGQFSLARRTRVQVETRKNGRAEAKGFVPNKELGQYVLRVTAEYGGQTASVDLKQTNEWSQSAQKEARKERNMALIWAATVAAVVVAVTLAVWRAGN